MDSNVLLQITNRVSGVRDAKAMQFEEQAQAHFTWLQEIVPELQKSLSRFVCMCVSVVCVCECCVCMCVCVCDYDHHNTIEMFLSVCVCACARVCVPWPLCS